MWVLGYLCFIIKELNLVLYCLLVVGWDGNSFSSEGLGWADFGFDVVALCDSCHLRLVFVSHFSCMFSGMQCMALLGMDGM